MSLAEKQKILSEKVSEMWKNCGFDNMEENQLIFEILHRAMKIAYCRGRMDGLNSLIQKGEFRAKDF